MDTLALLITGTPLLLALPPQDPATAVPPAAASPPGMVVDTFSEDLEGGAGGLAIDAEGAVYCADFGAKLGGGTPGAKVYKFDAEGVATVFADGFKGASGNAIGPDGAFFQSSIAGNFISRLAPGGEARVYLRENLRSPVGLAIDEEGVLFVANCGSGTIVECTPDGASVVFCSSPLLSCPNGLALGPEHNIYVSNFNNGDVIKVSLDGEATRLATLPGNNNGHLIHHDGFLYVVARGAHQIFKVSMDGKVELFAGSGQRGRADGPALEATFSFPNDIAVASDGTTFYVNQNASTTEPHTELSPMVVRRIRLAD